MADIKRQVGNPSLKDLRKKDFAPAVKAQGQLAKIDPCHQLLGLATYSQRTARMNITPEFRERYVHPGDALISQAMPEYIQDIRQTLLSMYQAYNIAYQHYKQPSKLEDTSEILDLIRTH